jgi:hypothetical protein
MSEAWLEETNRYDAARAYRRHHMADQGREPSSTDMFVAGTLYEARRLRTRAANTGSGEGK